MIYLGFLVLLGLLLIAAFFCFKKIVFDNKTEYLLYFLLASLPFYLTFQILSFQSLNLLWLGGGFRLTKDFFVLGSLFVWVLYKKDFMNRPFIISKLDSYFLIFFLLVLCFFTVQWGPASFINQLTYLRGMLLIGALYFFGRNTSLDENATRRLLHLILAILFLAFPVVLLEKLFDTHVQSLMGFTSFQIADGGTPTGRYGLTWTFEAESGAKRFASFFASPLELGTFSVLSFISSFALWRMNYKYKLLYGFGMLLSFLCLLFSFSRGPLMGFFLMLVFLVIVFGYWRYLILLCVAFIIFFGLIFLFSNDDLRYFIIDTLTLSDSSSSGHVLEWALGVESMLSNPFGLGLATSGNGGGVEEGIQIGGENQFIVYGVQFGWVGMLLYISIVARSIKISTKTFRLYRNDYRGIIPLIAAAFKMAFIMSLLTANAEIYGLVVFVSWWMVGYSVRLYQGHKKMEIVYVQTT